jgi:hypothetical protein
LAGGQSSSPVQAFPIAGEQSVHCGEQIASSGQLAVVVHCPAQNGLPVLDPAQCCSVPPAARLLEQS